MDGQIGKPKSLWVLGVEKATLLNNGGPSQKALIRQLYLRLFVFIPVLLVMFFLPAGTLAYWEAWIYLAILIIPIFFVFNYLLKNNPELLKRRMRMREKETAQKRIIGLSYILFLIVFLLPGFDRRWEWSEVPTIVVVVADVFVVLGYSIFVLVMKENRYASRVIEVAPEQQVISSGPYTLVRHPMYLGAMLMYLASPLALGSYWAMLPAVLFIPILVARILNEEKVLERELKGYQEYMQKVKYRLIPCLW